MSYKDAMIEAAERADDGFREVVTVDRPMGTPIGQVILAAVADEYGMTVRQLRHRSSVHRWVPARITAARRLSAIGYNEPLIGRIMNRDPSTVSWYLGRTSKRQPVNTP